MRYLTDEEVTRIPIPIKDWKQIHLSINVGQCEDRVLQLPTGQRLHAHVFPDGTARVHLDEYDPEYGFLHAFLHVSNETPYGFVLKLVAFAVFLGSIANNRK